MWAHLFGLLGLLFLLAFFLLGLLRLVIALFLLGAAITCRLHRSPGWSLGWLEVDPCICCPIRVLTGGVTKNDREGFIRCWVTVGSSWKHYSTNKMFTWSCFHSATELHRQTRHRFALPALLPVNIKTENTFACFWFSQQPFQEVN